MKLLNRFYNELEAWLIALLLGNMVLLIAVQVVMRYVFSNSLSWSEELVRWCFVWFIWIGVSYGFKQRKHVSVTALVNVLPVTLQKYLNIVVNVIVLWFMYKLFQHGYEQITSQIISRQSSIALTWPFSDVRVGMRWLYASLPFGALLSCLSLSVNLVTDIRSLFDSNTAQAATEGN